MSIPQDYRQAIDDCLSYGLGERSLTFGAR